MEVKDLKEVVKQKLGESYLPEFDAKLGEEKVLLDAKNFVPLSKLDNANATIKLLNEQIEAKDKTMQEVMSQRDKDLAKLKKEAEGNPDLVKSFEEKIAANKAENETLKLQNEEVKKKALNDRKHLALLELLQDSDVTIPEHRKLLALQIETTIGLDKIELDEKEKVKNPDDIVKGYKDNKIYEGFFGKTIIQGQEHQVGGTPELLTLESKLQKATETGSTIEIVSLKRQIAESKNSTNKN